jgi:hypothetical protein
MDSSETIVARKAVMSEENRILPIKKSAAG